MNSTKVISASMTDKDFLKLAVEEGKKGTPPYLFGAVVVKDNEVLSKDHSRAVEKSDPSAHAEISAIREASKKLGSHNIPGCTLYTSHEPCMMCFSCAVWAEIDRIVFATSASEQDNSMYDFKDVNIFEMAEKLTRPLKIEHIKL